MNLVHGIYAHPAPFWEQGKRLNDYGVNAVFCHSMHVDKALVERSRDEGCGVYAEFATLNGKYGDYVERHPDAHPIDDSGRPAPAATWFMGVCPTHEGFRGYRMDELRRLLEQYDLGGVWMDYLHWHAQFEDPYPIFIKTCFCPRCIRTFEDHSGLKVQGTSIPEQARWIFMNAPRPWEDWRVSVILDWAREFRATVKDIRPKALVGCYHCAWKDEDLGGVRRRCLGLDIDALIPLVDVFSPMIYHGRSGKRPEYVLDYVEYFSSKYPVETALGQYPRLWPIVQAHDEPRISPEEFEQVLRYGLSGNSTGVMMFTIGSVAENEGKMEAMRRVYTSARE